MQSSFDISQSISHPSYLMDKEEKSHMILDQ